MSVVFKVANVFCALMRTCVQWSSRAHSETAERHCAFKQRTWHAKQNGPWRSPAHSKLERPICLSPRSREMGVAEPSRPTRRVEAGVSQLGEIVWPAAAVGERDLHTSPYPASVNTRQNSRPSSSTGTSLPPSLGSPRAIRYDAPPPFSIVGAHPPMRNLTASLTAARCAQE